MLFSAQDISDVEWLTIYDNIRNQQRLVEFYDSRACVEAYDNTYEHEYKGGRWDVAFFWDHPYK